LSFIVKNQFSCLFVIIFCCFVKVTIKNKKFIDIFQLSDVNEIDASRLLMYVQQSYRIAQWLPTAMPHELLRAATR